MLVTRKRETGFWRRFVSFGKNYRTIAVFSITSGT